MCKIVAELRNVSSAKQSPKASMVWNDMATIDDIMNSGTTIKYPATPTLHVASCYGLITINSFWPVAVGVFKTQRD